MGTLKHAFRTLFKTPFVTGVAVLSLALGDGDQNGYGDGYGYAPGKNNAD